VNALHLAWVWFTSLAQWQGRNAIPTRLFEHLAYSGVSLLIASAVALPLGMFIGTPAGALSWPSTWRTPRGRCRPSGC